MSSTDQSLHRTAASVVAIGLNHTTAPIAVRERFAFGRDALVPSTRALGERVHGPRCGGAAIVSTCNRTELYLGASGGAIELALDWLAESGGVARSDLRPHTYLLEGADAARHAFRVASGMDSMVLGEPQILGQFKHAMRSAEDAGTLSGALHQMFQRSFAVAKDVRTSTGIGTQSVSMAAASVRLAGAVCGGVEGLRVLFIGAGEMIERVATHFAPQRRSTLCFANRTLEHAERLAMRFDGEALPLADVSVQLAQFDVIVTCTASPAPIVAAIDVASAMRLRQDRPLCIVDLAVPRDVEAAVVALPRVHLYTVDDLAEVVRTSGAHREAALARAEAIVDAGVDDFVRWLRDRDTVPFIQALQGQTDAWRECEIERARRQIARGEDIEEVLRSMSRGITQKMLHGVLVELKTTADDDRATLSRTLARVFRIGRSCPVPQADAADTEAPRAPHASIASR